MIAPVPDVLALSLYAAPPVPASVQLRLDGTERPLPLDVGDAASYPRARELEAALAERFAVAPACVLVTAGADEAIDRVCRAYLDATRTAVVTAPTFEMIRHYARLAGAKLREVPWPDGGLDEAGLLEATRDTMGICAVASPNNPTGLVADGALLARVAQARPETLLLADYAYVELADADPTRALLALPNVVITRTFSKAWGIPGARVGYALGPSEVIAALRVAGGPYSVARPSLALALQRLRSGEAEMQAYVARARQEVHTLSAWLREHGFQVPPSQANFVLLRGARIAAFADALAKHGVGTRAFPHDPQLADARRMAVPADAATFTRLLTALQAAFEEHA